MKKTEQNFTTKINLPPPPPPLTSGSNISEPFERKIDKIKDTFSNLGQPLNLRPNERSFEYYKGFYDATYQFMQILDKLIEAGVFSGTETNSNN